MVITITALLTAIVIWLDGDANPVRITTSAVMILAAAGLCAIGLKPLYNKKHMIVILILLIIIGKAGEYISQLASQH
jgi:hypothetical protein